MDIVTIINIKVIKGIKVIKVIKVTKVIKDIKDTAMANIITQTIIRIKERVLMGIINPVNMKSKTKNLKSIELLII